MESKFKLYHSSILDFSWKWVTDSYPFGSQYWEASIMAHGVFSDTLANRICYWPANGMDDTARMQSFAAEIKTIYEDYLSDYLAIYAGKLIAFEVMLRSYIID